MINQGKNQNPDLRDVELLYERVARMIQGLKNKYRLVNKIKLVESDRSLFFQFAQGTPIVIDKLKKSADVYVNFDQNKIKFEIVLNQELLEIEPAKLKENLMKKQLRELSYKKISFESKVCRNHDIVNDFESNQDDEYKPDECKELLNEKFETFPVYEEKQAVEILKKFLKKSMIETYIKDLVDLKFYINQDYEIVIEYKINDKSLAMKQKIKRKKWNDIQQSLVHIINYQTFNDITLTFLEQMFFTDEIMQPDNKQIIIRIIQNKRFYQQQRGGQLFVGTQNINLDIYKSSQWLFVSILPKSYNLFKRFNKYKILIIQQHSQLFFLNHQEIINILQDFDLNLMVKYNKLVETQIQKLEWIKKETLNKSNDQTLLKQILNMQSEVEALEKIDFLEYEISEKLIQIQKYQKELYDPDDETFQLNQYQQQLIQIQVQKLEAQINQIELLYKEYHRIHKQVINKIKNFKGKESVQENKKCLKLFYQRVLLEQKRIKESLPIYYHKLNIINIISQQQVMLLIGSTGSGKSTQVIQYLYEEIETQGRIICVEPRILAARSLAKRVAEEMDQKVGGLVQFLGEFGELNDQSKIVFTSDRILLNIFQKDELLSDFDIILIDEAHERNMNTDILLGLTKVLLQKRPQLKLIIMSATMDEKLFQDYFQCPSKRVEGRLFEIEVKYGEPFQDDYLLRVKQLLQSEVIDKIYYNEYEHKHVLVFLAGVDEIQRMLYEYSNYQNNNKILFLGLHGQMTTRDQFEIFKNTDQIKIIFTTRLAETALTINDVTTVIDIGVDRFMYFDQIRGLQVTKIDWISKAQADQRKGRAGRTRPGICYRLYSEQEYIDSMSDHKTPEIQRSCLDTVVLRIKSLNTDPFKFNFIQAPNMQSMQQSLEYLMDINAIDQKEKITPLGMLMSQIQTEPRMSRILIEAFYRNVFRETLSIISVMLNNQTLYVKDASIEAKLEQLHENGDFFTFSKIFWEFTNLTNMSKSNAQIRSFCLQKGYHYKTLKTCQATFNEIEKAFGYFSDQLINNTELKNSISKMPQATREDCVMRCFLSAFHPDLCVYNGNQYIGYTFIKNQKNVRIYGTCSLSLLNHYPKYIICTDLYQSKFDFCRVAQEVTIDQLRDVLNQEQLDKIENYIPKTFKYQYLENVPMSLMNHLSLKFTKCNYEEDKKKYTHYCNIDKDGGKFEIWAEEEFDLQPYKQQYYEMLKNYHYYKFYGQSMFVQFQHGAQVNSTQFFSGNDLFIIQFTGSPLDTDEIQIILDQNDIVYQNIFLQTINQFGYCGEIYINNSNDITQIIQFLNNEAIRKLQFLDQYYQIQTDESQYHRNFFMLKRRNQNNRIIRSQIELIFYGSTHSGYGFILFENDEAAQSFLLGALSIVKFGDKQQDLKSERKNELKITNIPLNASESEVLRYLQDLAHQEHLPIPIRLKLKPSKKGEVVKDWQKEIKELFIKYVQEEPKYIQLMPDKNSYKIKAKILNLSNPMKLIEMKMKINFEKNIIGTSQVIMDIQFKFFRFVSQKILKQNEAQIQQVKQKIFEKFDKNTLKIFSTGDNVIFIGKNPNCIRYANIELNYLLTGYNIKIDIEKKIFKKLIEDQSFKKELLSLEDILNFKYNKSLLPMGIIVIFVTQERLGEIQQEISQIINRQVQTSIKISVKNYSFKPLLQQQNNIIYQLEQKYQLSIDFNIQSKLISIYGKNEDVKKCKEELILSLQGLQNQKDQQNLCEICYSEMSQKFILLFCQHSFCRQCLVQFIKNQGPPLKCPSMNCGHTLSLQDIQSLVCESDFEKLIDKSFQIFKNQNIQRYIGCLTPDCQEIFLKVEPGQKPFYYCQSCLQSFCTDCQKFAHPNLSCKEAKEKFFDGKDMDEATLKSLNIKKCPSCSSGVEKIDGCNHMTCQNCKIHFCWICKHSANNGKDIYDHINAKHYGQLFQQIF